MDRGFVPWVQINRDAGLTGRAPENYFIFCYVL